VSYVTSHEKLKAETREGAERVRAHEQRAEGPTEKKKRSRKKKNGSAFFLWLWSGLCQVMNGLIMSVVENPVRII
jgi:hypothetical protein